jgi:hypothetical protein
VLERLPVRDFAWPEFDRWQMLFAEQQTFPTLWHDLERPPAFRASSEVLRAYHERKIYLLLDWLHSVETTRAEMRTALARFVRRGVRAEIRRQGDGHACAVCDAATLREVNGDLRKLPPFHPGCRCLVLATADNRVTRPMTREYAYPDGASVRGDRTSAIP